MKNLLLAAAVLFGLVAKAAADSGTDVTTAAKTFLAALTQEQAAKASFDLANGERMNWHFIPKERKGLTMREMQPFQQTLAYSLLGSTLSQRGFMKATAIMSLEQILLEVEQGRGPKRDPQNYFVSIFGTPGAEVWGWRFEGHHQSLNFTLKGDKIISATPNFFGTNPAEVREGPRKGLRVLGREEDLGRQIVTSLSAELQQLAIYTNKAPADIITGTNRNLTVLKPEGVPASKFNKEQTAALWELIKEYVYRYRDDAAREELEKMQKIAPDKIFFAWAGPTERGQGHYYRVQGPMFLIEYDNTQNNANHVHAVFRDLQNDFGDDILRQHYDAAHKK